MARISTYSSVDENQIGLDDLLIGSKKSGIGINGPIYETKSYRLGDLSEFFGLNIDGISTYLGAFNSDGSFSYSGAFASQSLSVIATAGYAAASSVTQLNTRVNIVLPNGGTTVAQSFANSVLSSSSSGLFATSQYAQNLGSSFGSVDANGNVVVSESVANSILATMNTSSLASASSVTQLNSTLTNDYRTTTATNTQINQSVATETSARASAVTTLNSSISIKPNILRATSAPTITQRITAGSGQSGAVTTAQDPAMGSLWIDTTATAVTAANGSVSQQPKNEFYVLQGSFGSAAWLKSQDASLLNTITSAATATSNLSTLTTADQARAAQVTKLNAQFTFSGGNINGVADALNTSINTAVSNGTGAISTSVDELKTQFSFDGNNITGVSDALNTSINTASSNAVSATANSLDKLEALFQFDGSGNVNGLTGSTIISSAIATSETNAVSTADTARATAQDNLVATISKVFRQNDAPAVTEPVNSIWYDTNDSNKSYVLVAGSPRVWTYTVDATLATSASVTQVSDTAADINGNLSASHSLMVNSGGAIAGMKVSATTNDSGVSTSDVVFLADQFTIKTSGGTAQPFSVSGNVVTINGSLKIGNTDASAIETKANAATTASAASTASNTQDKDDGSVGGWTLESGYIYSGAKQTSDTYSSSGITLYSGGALRAKEFYIANNGDAFFKGDISAASGTFGGNITIGVHTEAVFKASSAGIQLGNTTFADAEFSVTPAGVLKTVSGTVGGWTLDTNKLTSSGGNIVLSSDTSSLPSLFVTNTPTVQGVPATGGSTYSKGFSSTIYTPASGNFITYSGGVVSKSTSYGTSAGLLSYDVYFDANTNVAGVPVTFDVSMSDHASYNYVLRVDAVSNRSFSGQITATFGYQLWDNSASNTIAYYERTIGGTGPHSTDSSGNIDFSFNNIDVDGTLPSGTTLVNGRRYYLRRWLKEVRVQGQWSSATAYTVRFALPEIRTASIVYAIGRTDVFAGGLQAVKNSGAFLSLNRNSSNTAVSPFILSSGFFKHTGNINIIGELEATVKNFKISHPKPSKSDTHYLLHCSVESPRADLMYRGKVTVCEEVTSINIDDSSNMTEGTFTSLCRNVQCFVSNETNWNPVKARVVGNLLIITSKEVGSYDTISWMVVGERKDISIYNSKATDDNGKLIVELER